ncbi:hypothetical protein U1Q18_024046 [Sarracenia purpurea var. burkii]
MEGVGSRLGRASSRYGPATVFSGPVRKWRKQWVHVSSSSPSSSATVSYQNTTATTSRSNNGNGNINNSSALVLRRWTPISPSHAGDADKNSVTPEEPPRRKFRYIPIVVLEEQERAAEKVDEKAKTSKAQLLTTGTTFNSNDDYEEIQVPNKNRLAQQHSNIGHLNLDLGLEGHDGNNGSDGEIEEDRIG